MKTLTRLLVALAALAAVVALAQSTSQFTFRSPTVTTAPMGLYVDSAASDNNDCSQPWRACKTLSGAFAKMPDVVNHAVTVVLKPGTYTDCPVLRDKSFGSGGSLTITSKGASTTLSCALSVVNVQGLTSTTIVAASGITMSGLPTPPAPVTTTNQLYVDSTNGDDTRDCSSSGTGSCATHQRALNVSPKMLRSGGLVINTAGLPDGGAASYPCFYITGFSEDFGYGVDDAGILITGNLMTIAAPIVLADGGASTSLGSGTATATSAGSGVTFGSLTDSTKAWADGGLQGYLLEITAGTGAGKILPISANTGTVITVVGPWGSGNPVAGSSYAIRQPQWWLSGRGCPFPAIPNFAALGSTSAITVFAANNTIGYRSGAITLQNVGFNNDAGTGFEAFDNSAYLIKNFMMKGLNGTGVTAAQNATPRITVQNGSFSGTTATFAVSQLGGGAIGLNNVISYGANGALYGNSFFLGGYPSVSISNSESTNSSVAGVTISEGETLIQQSHFNCASSSGYGAIFGTSSNGSNVTSFANSYGVGQNQYSQNQIGSTCGTGIAVLGPGQTVYGDNNTGTAATNGHLLNYGGRFHLTLGSNVTGTTNEINLDNGAFTTQVANITASSCNLADGGVSGYGSKFCK